MYVTTKMIRDLMVPSPELLAIAGLPLANKNIPGIYIHLHDYMDALGIQIKTVGDLPDILQEEMWVEGKLGVYAARKMFRGWYPNLKFEPRGKTVPPKIPKYKHQHSREYRKAANQLNLFIKRDLPKIYSLNTGE